MGSSKKCCAACIGDQHLRREVFPYEATDHGTCSYCLSEDQDLLEPGTLRDAFAPVVAIYERDDDGETLDHWLKQDWAMFHHPVMDPAHAKELLADILDDGEAVRLLLSPAPEYASDALEHWSALRLELKHNNRFFPKSGIDMVRLQSSIGYLLLAPEEIPNVWYRARLNTDENPYEPDEMSAPPRHLATHGRANPAGIPYLYLASGVTTAIAELRPQNCEIASVAQIALADGLSIIDLAEPRRTVSPFVPEDVAGIGRLRADVGLLEQFGEELTQPVLATTAAIDYTPSQFLCEFIKSCEFEGVRYKSSVGRDLNLAIFEPRLAVVGTVTQHRVTRVMIEHEVL